MVEWLRKRIEKKATLADYPWYKEFKPEDLVVGILGNDRAGCTTLIRALSKMGPATSEDKRFRISRVGVKTTLEPDCIELRRSKNEKLRSQRIWLIDLCDKTDAKSLSLCRHLIYIVGKGGDLPTEQALKTARTLFTHHRGHITFVHSRTDELKTSMNDYSKEEKAAWEANYRKALPGSTGGQIYWTSVKNFGVSETKQPPEINEDVKDLRKFLLQYGTTDDTPCCLPLTDILSKVKPRHVVVPIAMAAAITLPIVGHEHQDQILEGLHIFLDLVK